MWILLTGWRMGGRRLTGALHKIAIGSHGPRHPLDDAALQPVLEAVDQALRPADQDVGVRAQLLVGPSQNVAEVGPRADGREDELRGRIPADVLKLDRRGTCAGLCTEAAVSRARGPRPPRRGPPVVPKPRRPRPTAAPKRSRRATAASRGVLGRRPRPFPTCVSEASRRRRLARSVDGEYSCSTILLYYNGESTPRRDAKL